jgi:quinoprotein glucose dehydrogenase
MNWGGVSVDPERQVMIVNSNHMANYVVLIPRTVADTMGVKVFLPESKTPPPREAQGIAAQIGTPAAVKIEPFLSSIGAPCQQPPWGRITGVDLRSGRVLWSHRLGTGYDSGPLGVASRIPFTMGVASMGGAVTTRSGLFFLAATQDHYIRAFDLASGRVLWRARLPAGGQATPATYISPKSGRQFVAIAAGGHMISPNAGRQYLIAYALPK